MKFEYEVITKCNIEVGQKLYGIIGASTRTYNGVDEIIVDEIDYNKEIVVFSIEQPCQFVECSFYNMSRYVFETKEEANNMYCSNDFNFGEGLWEYNGYEY